MKTIIKFEFPPVYFGKVPLSKLFLAMILSMFFINTYANCPDVALRCYYQAPLPTNYPPHVHPDKKLIKIKTFWISSKYRGAFPVCGVVLTTTQQVQNKCNSAPHAGKSLVAFQMPYGANVLPRKWVRSISGYDELINYSWCKLGCKDTIQGLMRSDLSTKKMAKTRDLMET